MTKWSPQQEKNKIQLFLFAKTDAKQRDFYCSQE